MTETNQEYRKRRAVQLGRLSDARTCLFYTHPIYYAIASRLGLVDATEEIETLAVGFIEDEPTCYFFYNVDYIASCSDDKLRFGLMHEFLHVGLNHPGRMAGLDRDVANIAADILVNEGHIKEYNRLPDEEKDLIVLKENPFKWVPSSETQPDGSLVIDLSKRVRVPNPKAGEPMFPCLKGISIRESTMEEIYAKLLKAKETKDTKKRLGEFKGDDHSKFTPRSSGKKIVGSDEISEEQKAVLHHLVDDAIKELDGKNPGDVPGELKRKIDDTIQKAAYPWRRELTMFVQTVVKEDKERSWRRYSRRYGAASPGHVREKRSKLLVLIDNSGSTMGLYDMFMGHVLTLSDEAEEILVVGCDTRVNFEGVVKGGKFPTGIVFKRCGGGTDMQPGFDYAMEHGCDGVICLTDGWMSVPDNHGITTLFAICGAGSEVPGFRNISIE